MGDYCCHALMLRHKENIRSLRPQQGCLGTGWKQPIFRSSGTNHSRVSLPQSRCRLMASRMLTQGFHYAMGEDETATITDTSHCQGRSASATAVAEPFPCAILSVKSLMHWLSARFFAVPKSCPSISSQFKVLINKRLGFCNKYYLCLWNTCSVIQNLNVRHCGTRAS